MSKVKDALCVEYGEFDVSIDRDKYIGGSDILPAPLKPEEEAVLLEQLEGEEEMTVKAVLIERNLRLVAHVVKKYYAAREDQDDLVSIGSIGLIKAVRSYKPESGRLATYASRCIENEILMYLRRTTRQKTEVSLDEPLNVDWDGNELLLSDVLGTDSDLVMRPIEAEVDRQLLHQSIARLEERERQIITMRYGLGEGPPLTQRQIAERLGISRSYVSRIEKAALDKLKEGFGLPLG